MEGFNKWGPATVVIVAIVVLAAAIGGVVVIVHPATLSFPDYLSKLQAFVVGVGLLALGRGAQTGLERHGEAVGRGMAAAKVDGGAVAGTGSHARSGSHAAHPRG